MSPVRRIVPAKWIRLICLVLFFAVAISSLPVHLKHNGASAQSSGPRRTQGAPSPNLPNLDDARGIEPGTPKIMLSVPATKCRGRDEKCKKAKGMISDNLPDNQDRLPAYARHRSGRDHADWLNTRIPALSMLAYLVYWPAGMISDFPDIPYRDGGSVLAESAVKAANPRKRTYGRSALGEARKEYGYRSGRSPVAAQSNGVVTVYPGAYQTPVNPGDYAVTSPSNTGYGSTDTPSAAYATGGYGYASYSAARSARWSAFQSVSGTIVSIRLKFDWSVGAYANASADNNGGSASSSCGFGIEYSLDGGSSWIGRVYGGLSASGNDY
jgi:hypothetical protein